MSAGAWSIITLAMEHEADVVAVRQRARRIAELLGFGMLDQTRIATAASEIARNAVTYARSGRAEFALSGASLPQHLLIRIADKGPGIANLDDVLEGRYQSQTGMGLGIIGARRLMDRVDIDSSSEKGTRVTLDKILPKGQEPVPASALVDLARRLATEVAGDPLVEVRAQNQELLRSLEDVKTQQDEMMRLNDELDRTNKGVVALLAELDQKATELETLNATLEKRVATAIAEREAAEQSLRQSQKMEAVGQLTGGIAHDFNNMLTGIVTSLDIIQSRIEQGRTDKLERYTQAAMISAQRAAALTHRLLAFSRRQPLDPKPVDAKHLVASMTDLIRQTIGPTHSLDVAADADLWTTLCDPNQLENAILNLSINARDAMPDGGNLLIETRNADLNEAAIAAGIGAVTGQYVAVCVTDTGTGMSADVLSRAFEPFFTTKPIGQGTGLGLSMVYGFARQSQGYLKIESEEGRGTTIRIYLPRHSGEILSAENAVALSQDIAQTDKGETILIVEDDAVIRNLTVEVLSEAGYRILQASDGQEGLRMLDSRIHIDLLLTDVGLPRVNGRQLADQARETRQSLKVLFITGYAQNTKLTSDALAPGMSILTKPFTVAGLINRVKEVLS
ncbi:ATP-binding protein [Acidisoma silvae]|uniref:histidine kinase n=1 Tax=Acidisoma silvae TaxID=2802396 RepID=A0A963YP75_9PROT|nr:ATP-binding protein [Acidisoma silvae]MCB8874236.1 response regulator [Acidisoma silvae]